MPLISFFMQGLEHISKARDELLQAAKVYPCPYCRKHLLEMVIVLNIWSEVGHIHSPLRKQGLVALRLFEKLLIIAFAQRILLKLGKLFLGQG
jgi:hypothetical protein